MFGIESLTGLWYAGATVGIVLVEAVVLYVGYGHLERVAGPVVHEVVENA